MKPYGMVEIRAVPYTGGGATGTAGTPAEFTVHILHPSDTVSSQISFTLVNAVTDTDIGPLTDGQVINLSSLPTNKLNIRANSTMSGTESVVFDFNGVMGYWTENAEPYALFGDNSGNYNQWTAVAGTHNLTVV